MTKIINLTPHDLNIVRNGEKETIISSGIARCKQVNEKIGEIDSIPIFKTSFGEVEGLPDEIDGVFLFVSLIIRNAKPNRKDLLSPCDLLRDEKGNIIGVTSFSSN